MKSKNINKMEELPLDDIESGAFDKRMKAREKKAEKARQARSATMKRGIIGAVELIVVGQLVYTTAYLLGVDLPFFKWMVIPQAILAAWMLLKKFIFNNGES